MALHKNTQERYLFRTRGIDSAGAILVTVDNVGLPFNIQQATSNFGLGAVQYYFENFDHYDEPIMSARSRLPSLPAPARPRRVGRSGKRPS